MKKIILLIILALIIGCKTTVEKPKEVVDFIQYDQKKFYNFSSSKSQPLITLVKNLEKKVTSFTSDFVMVLQTGENLDEERVFLGKLYFDKEKERMKVQLMVEALFYRLTVAEVVANPKTIKIRRMGDKKIHTLPMGNIEMQDPTTKKIIRIPFQVIFHSISLKFYNEFKNGNSFFSPKENRVLVKRDGDVYQYVFSKQGLDALDYTSKKNNLQSVSQVTVKNPSGLHPPVKIQTRAKEIITGKNTGLIDIKYKNVKRNLKAQESWFRL